MMAMVVKTGNFLRKGIINYDIKKYYPCGQLKNDPVFDYLIPGRGNIEKIYLKSTCMFHGRSSSFF
jgi:hypothetical protein